MSIQDVEAPGQPCRFCRDRKEACSYVPKDNIVQGTSSPREVFQQDHLRPAKRKRQNDDENGRGIPFQSAVVRAGSLSQFPSVTGTSPTESSLMMQPHMAEDITVLEQYLTSQTIEGSSTAKPYNTISNAPGNPIVYLTVPKRRKGLRTALDPGRTQREIMEQILSPFTSDILKLYFNHIHPCFPILDETTFSEMWHKDEERISSTLLCDMYASALSFWNNSAVLKQFPKPDVHFLWNQAVAALQDDFMAPTISTVHAALLDMVGRPVIQVTGNIVNAGRVVTLAQSLGLHRDPTHWKATAHEKSVRIRLWWGVLIHDYFSSLGHGIPPTINPRYYDVPVPTPEILGTSSATEEHRRANISFMHLCKLSQILGDVLPWVYALRTEVTEVQRSLRKIECALDDWADGLPDYLRPGSSGVSAANGASNLWFTYLSIKVLICRLAFKATIKDPKPSVTEARQYRLALLREAASEVVDFIASLSKNQLQEFWMPYTSYFLVTATTILLRCTIECGDMETKRQCATKLFTFSDRIRKASDVSGWDLADFCLERCDEPIKKIADALKVSTRGTETRVSGTEVLGTPTADLDLPDVTLMNSQASISDFFLPIDSLDYPWETLWDTFEGPWPIQI